MAAGVAPTPAPAVTVAEEDTMPAASGVASVNGTRLAYEVAGAGPPLVFLHGFSLDRRMWSAQIDAFAARCSVVRYDLRGFGESGPATGELYSNVDDLAALLDHLGVERAHIVGLSMGGGVAVDFALTHPDRTRTLVAVDAAVNGWRWSAGWDAMVIPVWEAGRAGDLDVARARWLTNPLFAPALEQPTVAAELREIIGSYSGWHWLDRSDGQRSPQPPAFQRLEAIAAPTLVVVGERDLPDFHACGEAMARRIPEARLALIPDAGHMANMENPTAFNDVVLRFLDEQ
jgi:pimeloyl-ACP methyl ester carboxylesterase